MYRYSLPAYALCLALVPGCGLLSLFFGGSQESGSADLKAFKSRQELADYFAEQINRRGGGFADGGGLSFTNGVVDLGAEALAEDVNGLPGPVPGRDDGGMGGDAADADSSESDFSQTTIQEEGVDEADVVKTDGSYLYIIHRSASGDGSGLLRIVDVTPAEELGQAGEVALEGAGREIYLYDGKVVALTETFGGYLTIPPPEPLVAPLEGVDPEMPVDDGGSTDGASRDSAGDEAIAPPDVVEDFDYERPSTIVTIIDAADAANPIVLSKTKFEGTTVSSRMIDGVLHLALANYQDYLYAVMPRISEPQVVLDNADVEVLLPDFARVDAEGEESGGDLISWRELYHPVDPDGFGMVTLVSLDVDNDASFTAVGVVAEPGHVYSSLNALYLTDTEYDFNAQTRETTDIYKFAYVGRSAEPRATGSVPGRVHNQYSMGEHEGYLRVATTIEGGFTQFFERTPPSNGVYVLGETADEPAAAVTSDEPATRGLSVIGKVEGLAVGEDIRSARFVGERGYLVTFERRDPLFTLDLSDPENPTVVGEWHGPGFSTFLVPMDEDHLLAVGQYVPDDGSFWGWGIQLTIFDVSDFSEPVEMDKVILGADGEASSEALYNPKAFTYFAERGLVALPATINQGFVFFDDVIGFAEDGVAADADPDAPVDAISPPVPEGFEGLVVFGVSVEDGFTELGRISTRYDDASGWWWNAFTRGVFIGDDVFAVTDRGVRGAAITDPDTMLYELRFDEDKPAP
ncbi:MAG: beta-propeller domain-containing protein [Phycisphaerae bacterium]